MSRPLTDKEEAIEHAFEQHLETMPDQAYLDSFQEFLFTREGTQLQAALEAGWRRWERERWDEKRKAATLAAFE